MKLGIVFIPVVLSACAYGVPPPEDYQQYIHSPEAGADVCEPTYPSFGDGSAGCSCPAIHTAYGEFVWLRDGHLILIWEIVILLMLRVLVP
jgi:hypothetical protein